MPRYVFCAMPFFSFFLVCESKVRSVECVSSSGWLLLRASDRSIRRSEDCSPNVLEQFLCGAPYVDGAIADRLKGAVVWAIVAGLGGSRSGSRCRGRRRRGLRCRLGGRGARAADGARAGFEHIVGRDARQIPAEGLVERRGTIEHVFECRDAGDWEKADMCLCVYG